MRERRAQKRFKRRFMVRYGEKDLTHSGFTSDISSGGAFIVAPQRPALDAYVHLHLFTDKETSVYLESTVRRHKIVPPQLRTLEKGGFGVRFRRPDEILADILFESGARLQVAYVTQDDLKQAYDKEFRHGGVRCLGRPGLSRPLHAGDRSHLQGKKRRRGDHYSSPPTPGLKIMPSLVLPFIRTRSGSVKRR